MTKVLLSRKLAWAMLGGIVTLAAIVLWFAPAEQTLGSGIQSVYLHVAFIWAGMVGLTVTALLGLVVAITGKRMVHDWNLSIAWTALLLFALGLVMSVVAAQVNWGAIFWQEPRTAAAVQVLALALIVQIVNILPGSYRLKGLLRIVPVIFMVWSLAITPLVLHPGNAARTSPSPSIRLTFFGLFALCCLAAAWTVLYMHRSRSRVSESVQANSLSQEE